MCQFYIVFVPRDSVRFGLGPSYMLLEGPRASRERRERKGTPEDRVNSIVTGGDSTGKKRYLFTLERLDLNLD